jgi:hypothetical protein
VAGIHIAATARTSDPVGVIAHPVSSQPGIDILLALLAWGIVAGIRACLRSMCAEWCHFVQGGIRARLTGPAKWHGDGIIADGRDPADSEAAANVSACAGRNEKLSAPSIA